MLSNAYFLAKFRFDTAENEPAKNQQNLNFTKFANFANLPRSPFASDVFYARCRGRLAGVPRAGGGARRSDARLEVAEAYGVLTFLRQTLQGSFSAVSKRNFASKYALESSRRDLHNAFLCTALKSHIFLKVCQNFAKSCKNFQKCTKFAKFSKIFYKIWQNFEIAELCKGVHCVDLGESFQTHIFLQFSFRCSRERAL